MYSTFDYNFTSINRLSLYSVIFSMIIMKWEMDKCMV